MVNESLPVIKNRLPKLVVSAWKRNISEDTARKLEGISVYKNGRQYRDFAVRIINPVRLADSLRKQQPDEFLELSDKIQPRLTRPPRNSNIIVFDATRSKIVDIKLDEVFSFNSAKPLLNLVKLLMKDHVTAQYKRFRKTNEMKINIDKLMAETKGLELVEAFIRLKMEEMILKGVIRGYYYSIHLGLFAYYSTAPYVTSETKQIGKAFLRFLGATQNYWNTLAEILERVFPSVYEKFRKIKDSLSPDFQKYCIGPFTTIAINYGIPNFSAVTCAHRDLNDLPEGICCVIPLGRFVGGALDLIEHGIHILNSAGDVIMFDSRSLHENTEVLSGIRYSLTCYVGEGFDKSRPVRSKHEIK
ncbi:hypothetical protein HK098_004127 [Nowakowskiella sp. JEL0407]|nr:hypothetical protein HK098_004127 [Nowakowskiella sp. JEL0407]